MMNSAPISVLRRAKTELKFWIDRAGLHKSPLVNGAEALASEIRSILGSSPAWPDYPADGRRLKIAVVPGNGLHVNALSMDALWMMALQSRGHDCIGLLCGEGLPSCEFNITGPGLVPAGPHGIAFTAAANRKTCAACSTSAQTVLEATGLPYFRVADFGSAGEVEEIQQLVNTIPVEDIRTFHYEGIGVGDHAFASTLRITMRGEVDLGNAKEVCTYRRQLLSTILMVRRLRRFLEAQRPDHVVCVHGVYLIHGTLADVCAQMGISCSVFGAPYRKGTVLFSHNETYHRSLVVEPNTLWESLELTEERQSRLQAYADSKVGGGRDYVNYHPNPVLSRQAVIDAVGLDPNKPIITLYTNVIWDAQIFYSFNAFDSIFDWLYSTIDYFKGREDLQLVIRVHPAEVKGGSMPTRQPITPEIRTRYPELPKNIFIVPPESDVSSYTLAEISKATLIYGTKMGLEIALRGIPVIVAGETFNRRKGFTHDIETRRDYFELLDRIEDLPPLREDEIERARKFAYYLFFQKMMDMPLLAPDIYRNFREAEERYYTFTSVDDLRPGQSRNLDVICDGIVNGFPFIADP